MQKYKAFNFILNFLEELGEMYWLSAWEWEVHLPRGRAVCRFSKPFPSEVVHRALKRLEKRHQPKTPGPALSALSLTHYENPPHLSYLNLKSHHGKMSALQAPPWRLPWAQNSLLLINALFPQEFIATDLLKIAQCVWISISNAGMARKCNVLGSFG